MNDGVNGVNDGVNGGVNDGVNNGLRTHLGPISRASRPVSHLDLGGRHAAIAAQGCDELALRDEVGVTTERRGGHTRLCDTGETTWHRSALRF